ncbi:MAG TPA: PilZ domain-containing protein [Acidobacteriota bacterium]|nr:PilZ domain-containing protein [Acidobacteriota bacterium]
MPANEQVTDDHSKDSMDPKFYAAPDDALQIRIPDGSDPTTYYSRVVSISNGVMVISWPTDRGIRLITRPGNVLDVFFMRDGIPHSFSGVVEKTETEPPPQITVIVDGPAQQIQRRQYYRSKCLLPLEIAGTVREDEADGTSPSLILIRTITSDISAGGVSFRYARRIPLGTQLNLKLSLPDNKPAISIPCSVIYSEFVAEHQKLYRTGLRYLALSEGERARIVRFIYRTQLQSLHD